MSLKNTPQIIDPPSGLPIAFIGPELEKGPMPALFYFALTGRESLETEPFNTPAALLEGEKIRVYSMTIPGHAENLKHTEAMGRWTEHISKNENLFAPFLKKCQENINFLIDKRWIQPDRIAAAGLSRGAFIATHLGALDERVNIILGFAPLTTLKTIKEMGELLDHPISKSLEFDSKMDKLVGKKLRYYVGNRDTRVGTEQCFSFIKKITELNHEAGIRSPGVELIIYPSIGHRGHGTPPDIFQEGVNWIKKLLL